MAALANGMTGWFRAAKCVPFKLRVDAREDIERAHGAYHVSRLRVQVLPYLLRQDEDAAILILVRLLASNGEQAARSRVVEAG